MKPLLFSNGQVGTDSDLDIDIEGTMSCRPGKNGGVRTLVGCVGGCDAAIGRIIEGDLVRGFKFLTFLHGRVNRPPASWFFFFLLLSTRQSHNVTNHLDLSCMKLVAK